MYALIRSILIFDAAAVTKNNIPLYLLFILDIKQEKDQHDVKQ